MTDNKIELSIAGLSIVVSTPEDAAFTKALAEEVDGDIRAIMRANEGASVTSAALLCAIDYLFSEKRAEKSSGNMRNQIKDYLAEAASAKLECEEEHRRSLDLSAEIQTLRAQLTRLAVDSDNTITERMKSQLTATTNELTTMRSRVNELIAQNKSLSDKSAAMSELIAQRDAEIARLGDDSSLLKSQIASRDGTVARQAQTIDELTKENRESKEEVARLNSELDTLESLILEEERRAREIGSQAAETAAEPEQSQTGYEPYGSAEPIEPEQTEADCEPSEPTAPAEPEAGGEQAPRRPEGGEAAAWQLETEESPESEEPEAEVEDIAPEQDKDELEQEEEEPEQLGGFSSGFGARASLSDPVPDEDKDYDGEPKRQLFDYEASLADDEYEQLDVAMIAEVAPEERVDFDELEDEPDDEPDDEDDDEPDEPEESGEALPGEPDYKLRTDAIPRGFESLADYKTFDSDALEEAIEPIATASGESTASEIDDMLAHGADDALSSEPEERTVHVQRRFDSDELPEKPDLSWTLEI